MNDNAPKLRAFMEEVRKPGYLARAHQRAQRRKSAWNILLIPLGLFSVVGFTYIFFQIMWRIHIAIYPEHAGRLHEFWGGGISFPSFISSFLLLMPLFFASLPLGLMLANCVAWCVGPARRAFDREAQGVKWASLHEAMSGLWAIARMVVPLCLLLSFIGAVTLRNLK
ncbi:MAG TPA: hypothetical protein PLU30_18920 [Verrucomicrobiae bacterium]|nr:hypothetical protein [Verrucomicrobiae bacterium]